MEELEPNPNAEMDQLRLQISHLIEEKENLRLHLEIANERWVETVNENAQLKVQLRKMQH